MASSSSSKAPLHAFVALFRGVNVSGKNRMDMKQLHKLFVSMKFEKAETYVQSGNVVFGVPGTVAARADANALGKEIRAAVEHDFGFTVPLVIAPADMMGAIVRDNPFLKGSGNAKATTEADVDPASLHFTFICEDADGGIPGWRTPDSAAVAKLDKLKLGSGEDEYRISPYGIYLRCPNGYGRTKLSNTSLEHVLKRSATTRNWKSMRTLAEKAKEIGARDAAS